ncbi:SNF2-related protein [Parafrankia sp. Ea1.12]|uniref:DEAD/DEAH box helicase n=1 Tax=Parafrankia sp. Ea1.12 TaxID=573499 RepID=UPI000DA5D291|nr:DEAD/DEAH box helicase [Parafrankia sp. Ea1.12]SQD94353.1 SNF2-related protein [Parafrankia sp. Ea1.12]
MLPAALRSVDDHHLRAAVGDVTYRRGAQYARQGAVSEMSWEPVAQVLQGRVEGSHGERYLTTVSLTGRARSGAWRFSHGECSCPVGVSCKHAVALVLTAAQTAARDPEPGSRGRRAAAAPATWASSLSALLGDRPADGEPRGATPLALELTLSAEPVVGRSTSGGPSLRVLARVVKPGKNGWVGGPAWSKLSAPHGPYQRDDYLVAHLRVLREMYAVYRSGDEDSLYRHYSHRDDKHIDLGAFTSPRLWPLLDEAIAAGIQLVHGRKRLGNIEPYGSAELCLDVTCDPATAALTVRPVLRVAGSDAAVAPFAFIGGHGVVGIDRAEIQATDRHADWHIRLARLTAFVPPALVRMAVGNRSLEVPAAERSRFVREFYPGLRQLATIVSSDGSFEPPVIAPPVLVARADYGPDHTVEITWEWDYSVGDTRLRAPLHGDGTGSEYRDRTSEAEILTGLDLPLDAARLLSCGEAGVPVSSVRLSGVETMRFTTELLPLLAARDGIAVEVGGRPAAYREVGDLLRIEVSTDDVPNEPDWFDLGLAITLDGRQVPFSMVFLALSRGESHLLLDDGAYFSLDKPELRVLRQLIEEARALQDAPGGPLRISRFQAGLWEELAGLGVVVRQAAAWRRQVAGLLDLGSAGAKESPGMLQASLRPYQSDGYQWLSFLWDCQLGGILADDMGLGKTLQSLALICHARQADPALAPFLIVAPTSVVSNWVAEAARFAPALRVTAVTDTLRRRGQTLDEVMDAANVVVTSYTLFRLDEEAYSGATWAGLILDEAQIVKNSQSKAYQCARLLPAPFKLAVTGTPLENNVMELWSLLSITAPGLFPNRSRFQDYYARPIEKQGNTERLAQLRRRIRPLILRRTKEQVAPELPVKQEQVLEIELHPRHRKVYQTRLQRERQKVLGLIDDMNRNRFTILRSLTTLRQLSLHAGLVDDTYDDLPSAKIDILLEQLRDVVDGGHRALVFSQFTRFLGRVRDSLAVAGIEYCYLDGTTRNRSAVVRRFKEGAAPVFLISLKAGGYGLNLTEADYCFLLDPWWNPATEAQAVDRTHRIGQTRNVMAYRLVAKDTIEEKVMALQARKAELFTSVMDDGEFVDATLDANDIRQLLS